MVTISPTLEAKIERRARRAFRYHDEGGAFRIHRVTSVSDSGLKYRVPRSGRKYIEVVRDEEGDLFIDPPTTGLVDLQTSSDFKKLKNQTGKHHAGEVVAFLLADKRKKIGKGYKPRKPVKLLSRKQCVSEIKAGQFVFVAELTGVDIDTVGYDHVMVDAFTVTGELDAEKDLGFTTGLLDLKTKADVISLRKKKHLGKVRAYKYTDENAESPIQSPKIKYVPGKDYEIKDANTDPSSTCHKGINVADMAWTKKSCHGRQRVFAFEFEMEDIAAVPTNTDGKFRVHRCKCIEELHPATFKPIVKVVEENGKRKKTKKPKKKKGLMDKLFGSGDDD
jgi:hypothetical protein